MARNFIKVCSVEEVPPGTGKLVMGPFDKPMALFNVAGEFFAINAICPHMGGPLQSGKLEGKVIYCPWHQWSFCVDTGEADHPGGHRVSAYHVKVQEGMVMVGWLKNSG
jgi:nitrite reductase/ring-hydroxylating ferredoxin subunit